MEQLALVEARYKRVRVSNALVSEEGVKRHQHLSYTLGELRTGIRAERGHEEAAV